jgi:hypothetical protein
MRRYIRSQSLMVARRREHTAPVFIAHTIAPPLKEVFRNEGGGEQHYTYTGGSEGRKKERTEGGQAGRAEGGKEGWLDGRKYERMEGRKKRDGRN